MEKVDKLKREVIIGEILLVLCVVRKYANTFTPVLNHVHGHIIQVDNREEHFSHYHYDARFVDFFKDVYANVNGIKYIMTHQTTDDLRPEASMPVAYLPLKVMRVEMGCPTPTDQIGKMDLKHDCIINGRCPHTGYDLSNVKPVDGVITCPLHYLQFDATTGHLLTKL